MAKVAIKEVPYNESPKIHYEIPKSKIPYHIPLMIAVPTTGIVRFEWHISIQSLVIPVAFSAQRFVTQLPFITPIGFHVAEARNICVDRFIQSDTEWLFFVDHDVLLPPMTYAYMMEHMLKKKYPIVSGLYYTKGNPSVPLVFRDNNGKGPFTDFKEGDKVRVSAVPMGCTIIHRSILEYMYKKAREVRTMDGRIVKEVFRTPRDIFVDPEQNSVMPSSGTEDIQFCHRIINEDVLEKTGWKSLKKSPYPFLCDTRIFCGHITQEGTIYPQITQFGTVRK